MASTFTQTCASPWRVGHRISSCDPEGSRTRGPMINCIQIIDAAQLENTHLGVSEDPRVLQREQSQKYTAALGETLPHQSELCTLKEELVDLFEALKQVHAEEDTIDLEVEESTKALKTYADEDGQMNYARISQMIMYQL